MFWDKAALGYDFVENAVNKRCYNALGSRVAQEISPADSVLECACGTGVISVAIAPVCKSLTATDLSTGMLMRAEKKLSRFGNVRLRRADITHIRCRDASFDKVVAGNVIHLVDDPRAVLAELMRVCKPGGKVIIPTYINETNRSAKAASKLFDKLGAGFVRQFDEKSYKEFFAACGCPDASFDIIDGRMPCMLAVITKE